MARKQETRTIGKHTYKLMRMGGMEGTVVLMRLAKALGPIMVGFFAAKGGTAGTRELAEALKGLEPEDVTYFCQEFGKYSEVNTGGNKWPSVSDVFDEHFAGEYEEMFRWLYASAEFNFDFFSKMLARLQSASEQPEATNPTTESTST